MRLMLDLNVMLDVLQRREPFFKYSAGVLSRVVKREDSGCIPSHALTTIHYVMRKYDSRERANEVVDWVLAHLEVIPQDKAVFFRARGLGLSDFEDAAVASAAEAAACDRIVTRNVVDFSGSPVPAVTPEEFLAET
jgi:predicted nucleic acid-binding protein